MCYTIYNPIQKILNIYKQEVPTKSMKLQKQLSRKSGDKEYPKYVTVIPPEAIKKLNWVGGDELELEIRNGVLCIKKKK